jgi:hypothetical protein
VADSKDEKVDQRRTQYRAIFEKFLNKIEELQKVGKKPKGVAEGGRSG